jgi:hypothetical protein
MFHNGVADIFDAAFLSTILKIHFSADDLALLRAASVAVATLLLAPATASPSRPEPASAPGFAPESALSRGWRRLRQSAARRWAAATER